MMNASKGFGVPQQREVTALSVRELSFFGLQAAVPTLFAFIPVAYLLIASLDFPADLGNAARKLTDGTLILIAFTMLISLSQDLGQSVRPYRRKTVAKLETLLRIGALIVLGLYSLFQLISVRVSMEIELNQVPPAKVGSIAVATPKPLAGAVQGLPAGLILNTALTLFSIICLLMSLAIVARVFSTLRPHFVDEGDA